MKWLFPLIIIGLVVAGALNREKLLGLIGRKTILTEETETVAQATPHPATDSIAKARQVYPALAVANSPFNKKFVELYNGKKASDPAFLAKPDWPMQLAEQVAHDMGVASYAQVPPPSEQSRSPLNSRPPGSAQAVTVPPSVALPGLKGSALDQRPSEKHK